MDTYPEVFSCVANRQRLSSAKDYSAGKRQDAHIIRTQRLSPAKDYSAGNRFNRTKSKTAVFCYEQFSWQVVSSFCDNN